MPIHVTCPGCRKRFTVSDKFAGKEGPCPNCKTTIRVPAASEQVVVHAPEEFGPKTRTGEAVLRPIARTDTVVKPLEWFLYLVGVGLVLGLVWWQRSPEGVLPVGRLAAAAILLAFPLVRLGYAFLREHELAPFTGRELWVRVAIVSAVYAATWAAIGWLPVAISLEELSYYEAAFLLMFVAALGTAAAHLALELELTSAFLHYGLYLGTTILLRLLAGLSPLSVPVNL